VSVMTASMPRLYPLYSRGKKSVDLPELRRSLSAVSGVGPSFE
jgi:hypothetical protein